MKKNRSVLLTGCSLILFLTASVFATQYLWPTNSSQTVTAVFGDIRPRRYHAGLDIRTYGKTGFEIYAIADGYVQRVRTGSSGYGRALYLMLDDGNTAVYAHLQDFFPELNEVVHRLQLKNNRYRLEHYFKENEFRVHKGQVLGHTGDTGSINGPHLHFEIRDQHENPLNPLNTNLNFSDSIYPEAEVLEILPLETAARVNDALTPQLIALKRRSNKLYQLEQPVKVYGEIGLAVKIKDKIDGQPFNYNIHRITLFIDGKKIYDLSYDHYRWEEDPLVFTEMDFRLWHLGQGKFHRLYTVPASQSLSFIGPGSNGRINLIPGEHGLLIRAADSGGNEISLTGSLIVLKDQPQTEAPAVNDSLVIPKINFKDEQLVQGLFFNFKTDDRGPLPVAMLINGLKFPLQSGPAVNSAEAVISLSQLQNQNLVQPLWGTEGKTKGGEFRLNGFLAIPGEPFELKQGPVTVSGGGQTFYDTAYVQIKPAALTKMGDFPHPVKTGPVYHAGPENIPFRKAMDLTMQLPTEVDQEHAGIFYWDKLKEKWYYLDTARTEEANLTTRVLSAENFVVISETVPPEITDLTPVPGATYARKELEEIVFKVQDVFAGLDGEGAVTASLDGKPLLLEYNSYREGCNYAFEKPPDIGKHNLHIEATDHLGNSTALETEFYIKK